MRCRNEYLNCKVLICDIIVIANVNADGFCYPTAEISLQNFTYVIWNVNYNITNKTYTNKNNISNI